MQAALNLPLKPGSRVLVGSSGAAQNGSPLSGGYAGAKRMLWFMAKYANGVSKQMDLGIRFQAIVPMQMIGGTGVGDTGANAYAQAMGVKPEEFLARCGAPVSGLQPARGSIISAICRSWLIQAWGDSAQKLLGIETHEKDDTDGFVTSILIR